MKFLQQFIYIPSIILLLGCHSVSTGQTTWYKYPGNPVFKPGGVGEWDQVFLDGSVIYDSGMYHMWYSALSRQDYVPKLGYASSPDGFRWEKYEHNPVNFESEESWDDLIYSFEVFKHDSIYLLYYAGVILDSSSFSEIGMAYSFDRVNWIKYPLPVIEPERNVEEWIIGGPNLFYDGKKFHNWYNRLAYRLPKKVVVGHAISTDGIHWVKDIQPVFLNGPAGSFDDHWVLVNDVNFNDSIYELWYSGWDLIRFGIGLATSRDGIHWNRVQDEAVMETGPLGSWDSQLLSTMDVISHDSTYKMWYVGNNIIKSGIGYATTSRAESLTWDTLTSVQNRSQIQVNLFNKGEIINLDSLTLAMSTNTNKERIDALNTLALAYSLQDNELSLEYALEALDLSRKNQYAKGRALAYYSIGNNMYLQDKYVEAMESQLRALWLFDSLEMLQEAGNLMLQIAGIHSFAGSYDQSIKYISSARELFKSLGDTLAELLALSYLGDAYMKAKDTLRAKNTFYHQIDLADKYNDITERSNAYISAGAAFATIDLDSSLYFLDKAKPLLSPLETNRFGLLYMTIADAYFNAGPQYYKKAEKNYLASKDNLLTAVGEGLLQPRLCYGMAELYFAVRDYDESKEYLSAGIQLCMIFLTKHDHRLYPSLNNKLEYEIVHKTYLQNFYHLHYRLDTTLRDKEAALNHYILATAWKDSLANEQSWKKVAMTQGNYEIENSRNMITILEKENEVKNLTIRQTQFFLFALAGFVVLIILMGFLFIRQNRIRAQHNAVLLEQKLFRLQMNPHFIFNALSEIMNFIGRKELDKANSYLANFSQLLRSTLQGSREDYIYLDEEIDSLRNYLNLQTMRYPNKFDFTIEQDEEIEEEKTLVPPMLLQPFVENAIEHGISHKEGKGHIAIRFRLSGKTLICSIEDDGVGREQASKINYTIRGTHKSLATAIIYDRIKALNKKLKQKISMEIIDLKNENNTASGTKVVIKLPYLLE